MNKLTDLELELIKKIAKIEGKTFVNYFGDPFVQNGIALTPYNPFVQNGITLTSYNPLTDKAMLLDLIFDYGVSVCRDRDCVYIESDWRDRPHKSLVSFSSKEEFSRAALECIVEANNV